MTPSSLLERAKTLGISANELSILDLYETVTDQVESSQRGILVGDTPELIQLRKELVSDLKGFIFFSELTPQLIKKQIIAIGLNKTPLEDVQRCYTFIELMEILQRDIEVSHSDKGEPIVHFETLKEKQRLVHEIAKRIHNKPYIIVRPRAGGENYGMSLAKSIYDKSELVEWARIMFLDETITPDRVHFNSEVINDPRTGWDTRYVTIKGTLHSVPNAVLCLANGTLD